MYACDLPIEGDPARIKDCHQKATRKMRLISIIVLLLTAAVFPLRGQVPTQDLVFPHFAVGGGWESRLTLVAEGADHSEGWIIFGSQRGQNMTTVLVDGEPMLEGHFISYSLAPLTSRTFVLTSDSAEPEIGFIVLVQSYKVEGNGAVDGSLTYRFKDQSGRVLSQVGVPPSEELQGFYLPFDNTNGNRTAFAVVSGPLLLTGETARNPIKFEWFTSEGQLQESKSIELDIENQTAMFVDELFPASARQSGLIVAKPRSTLYAVALEIANGEILTSASIITPVVERNIKLTWDSGTPLGEGQLKLMQEGPLLKGVVLFTFEGQEQQAWFGATGAWLDRGDGKQLLTLTLLSTTGAITMVTTSVRQQIETHEGNFVFIDSQGKLKDPDRFIVTGTFEISLPGAVKF